MNRCAVGVLRTGQAAVWPVHDMGGTEAAMGGSCWVFGRVCSGYHCVCSHLRVGKQHAVLFRAVLPVHAW